MKVGNLQRPMSLFRFLPRHVFSTVRTFKWRPSSSLFWFDICKISP